MATTEFSAAAIAKAIESVSDDIKREVVRLIEGAAVTTRNRVQQAYPVGPTGNLRRMVHVSSVSRYTTTASGVPIPVKRVRASAPHVHIFQEGTGERVDATRGNARRGRSPRHGRIFEGIAAEVRGVMLRAAQDVVETPREIR